MNFQHNFVWRSFLLRATLTIALCAILALPLNLVAMSIVESVYDGANDRIDFSLINIATLKSEIWSAIFPFQKPEKFPVRLIAGSAVGVAFVFCFGILGNRNWTGPLGIGILFLTIATFAFFVSGGAIANSAPTSLESVLLLLAFALPALVLWFILRFLWR
jgi:hypothetical protein